MPQPEVLIVIMACLLVISVLLTRIFAKGGVPSLLVCCLVGLAVGNGGTYDFVFDQPSFLNIFGQIALAAIIFVGGFQTDLSRVRKILLPAGVLATIGVVVSAAVFGSVYHLITATGFKEALLLGAIVSSTDAAAVFAILENKRLNLHYNLSEILEVESGVNDPIALFLVGALIAWNTGEPVAATSLAFAFLSQVTLGVAIGALFGKALNFILIRNWLDDDSLVIVLVVGWLILTWYSLEYLGANLLIGAYSCGIAFGHKLEREKSHLTGFLSGISWTLQAGLFLLMGLQIFPNQLTQFLWQGLLVSLILVLLARPCAIIASGHKTYLKPRVLTFLSWAGLRGATPVVFAVYALQHGVRVADDFMNIIFFVVLFSVLIQGSSLGFVANKLGLSRK